MHPLKQKLYEVLELALEPAEQPGVKAVQNLDLSIGARKEGVNVFQLQSINVQVALGIVQAIRMIDEMPPKEDIIQALAFNEVKWENAQKQFCMEYLRKILEMCFGNHTEAAKILGVHRTYLHKLSKKYLEDK